MNHSHFHHNDFHEALLILIPLIINLAIKIGLAIVDRMSESNESRLKSMLEAIGTRPLVDYTVSGIISLGWALLLAPIITLLTYKTALQYVSYGLILLFVMLYIVETYLLTQLIRVLFSHHVAEGIEIVLELFGVLIQVQTVLTTVIHPEITYATSVLPYM